MSVLILQDKVADLDDWTNNGQPWTVTLSEASYIAKGCQLMITGTDPDELTVELSAMDGSNNDEMTSLGSYPAVLLSETGYLSMSGTTQTRTLTQQGTCWEAGTPVAFALAILFFEDSEGEDYKQITSLSYVGDPEDAGVMAAEAGEEGNEPDEGDGNLN